MQNNRILKQILAYSPRGRRNIERPVKREKYRKTSEEIA
jgi:hypothetical protein